jgi:hypothetical protein
MTSKDAEDFAKVRRGGDLFDGCAACHHKFTRSLKRFACLTRVNAVPILRHLRVAGRRVSWIDSWSI